jgi:8-oxo-dGTP pyrophosphatase MutT (NUDIX family)
VSPPGARGEEPIFRDAGVRELHEETGLTVRPRNLQLALTKTTPNQCRRQPVDGDRHWHLWRVYIVQITGRQQARGNADESADLRWYTPAEVRALPDLEPVWRDMLTTMRVI